MSRQRFVSFGVIIAALQLTGLPAPASGQLIPIRTVPLATGDQFQIFPSRTQAMGNLSITIDDLLHDPFVNPAMGARLEESFLLGSPSFYSVTTETGGAKTLPMGALFNRGDWFGAATVAIQQFTRDERPDVFILAEDLRLLAGNTLSERSNTNKYVTGAVGKRIEGTHVALAAGFSYAGLEAMDGVDLLYADASSVDQSGNVVDARLGLYGAWPSAKTLQAVLVYNRVRMTHDVGFIEWRFDPLQQRPLIDPRFEENLDHTNTWGLHLNYTQPLAQSGWTIGGEVTGNRKSHPKIPNYDIQNIPRDPGTSWAYNFGVGVSKKKDRSTLGMEFVYEPIWSDTWAEAAEPTETDDDTVIPVGGKTVENEFWFSNSWMRLGIDQQTGFGALQLGIQMRSIDYELEQFDHVARTRRTQHESWIEWTPTWGVSADFEDLSLQYSGRVTTGTGQPGVAFGAPLESALDSSAGDFLLAPQGPLTLQEARVTTHQITVQIPFR